MQRMLQDAGFERNELLLCPEGAGNVEEENRSRVAKQMLRYMQEHYTQDISLTTAADHLCYSPSYLSWLFKRQTGRNFWKCLSDYRLNKACLLLRETNNKVTQIASQVGFGSSKYFITVFKKRYGMTPQEWRNKPEG